MNDRAVSILENYDAQILRTTKGRGTILAETEQGWLVLKEYGGPVARLEILEKVLMEIRTKGFERAELILRNKEGELISYDQDQIPYIVKTYIPGRECNLRDMKECQNAVRTLAKLHNAMELPEIAEEFRLSEYSLEAELEKHNRELKKVRRYLRGKGQKTDFERYLFQNFDIFYEKARTVLEDMKAEGKEADEPDTVRQGYFCHGDLQHHNLIWNQDGFSVLNFEKCTVDNPVRDLYQFLRKLLEKNSWSVSLGLSILTAYETQRILSERDRRQLYYRFSYPEKFWKIVNFYYNNGKAWIPGKNREKLEVLLSQENEKKRFLESVLK